jgi:hypothetical protein
MSEVKQRLKAPAIGLIAVGVMNAVFGLILIFGTLLRFVRPARIEFGSEEERLGYLLSGVVWPLLGLITIILSPLVIYGAIQMLKARRYGMARLAAILSLIPLSSCCFILGIPVGIWAFIVLRQPEVRAEFNSGQR